MSVFPVILLLLAPPVAREPVGAADWERIEDPLERRVASLLAGEPVLAGIAAIVPLYARVPSEAGLGRPSTIGWADERLRARLVADDGQTYLRIVNQTPEALLVAAGTVFAAGGTEVALARDAVVPGGFAALVPAAPLATEAHDADLRVSGRLPPLATGSLLAGLPAFGLAVADARTIRGEDLFVPVLATGQVRARREALASVSAQAMGGLGGTAVGAVFLVGDRPDAAHVFARHDLFVAALPDLLQGLAVAVRDEELRHALPPAGRRPLAAFDVRSRALAWLRGISRTRAVWSESYGAGFEALATSPALLALGHGIADERRDLVHAGFYAALAVPVPGAAAPISPRNPPGDPEEGPTGFRARPTVADERRAGQFPNPGPAGPPAGGGANPGRPDPTPGGAGGGGPGGHPR